MTLTEKSGHMAWCALVAQALARQDSGVLSLAQENLFLTRRLATDLKQRRFSRDVTPDIEWMLKQGRQLGVRAELSSKLDYLWRSCTDELSERNDRFRLTYVLETAKDMDWNCCLLSDREWSGRHAVTLKAGVNGIYLSRTNLDIAFNDSGQQINPLTARLSGNVAGVVKRFNRCGWQAEPEGGASLSYQFTFDSQAGAQKSIISDRAAPGLLVRPVIFMTVLRLIPFRSMVLATF